MRKITISGKKILKGRHFAFVRGRGYIWMNLSTSKYAVSDPDFIEELAEAAKYKSIIYDIAENRKIAPSIIAGIGSRESRWGLAQRPPGPEGTGDFVLREHISRHRTGPLPPDGLGFGRGLMQIDYDYHEFARTGNWRDPAENIDYAVKLLVNFLRIIERNCQLDKTNLLRAGIASYNAGPGRVLKALRRGLDIDYYTTGGNYSADIIKRAEFFRLNGWN